MPKNGHPCLKIKGYVFVYAIPNLTEVKGDVMNLTVTFQNVNSFLFYSEFCLCYPDFMFKTGTCHDQGPS